MRHERRSALRGRRQQATMRGIFVSTSHLTSRHGAATGYKGPRQRVDRGEDGRQDRAERSARVLCVHAGTGAGGSARPEGAASDRRAGRVVFRGRRLGCNAPEGGQLAVRAVPHRYRGIPPLRGDRSPLPFQRIRRAGGGGRQRLAEEAADRGVPPGHRRSAAGGRRRGAGLHAVGSRQAGCQRLRSADRAGRPA